MVIYDYMKTYSIIFCEINNPIVILYTILIFDYMYKYFFTYYLIIQYNIILISIKCHLNSYSNI